jgi:hypothetical protein
MDLLRQNRESNETARRDGGYNNSVNCLDHCAVPIAQPLASAEPNDLAMIWLLLDRLRFASAPRGPGDRHHTAGDFCKRLKTRYNSMESRQIAKPGQQHDAFSQPLAVIVGAG